MGFRSPELKSPDYLPCCHQLQRYNSIPHRSSPDLRVALTCTEDTAFGKTDWLSNLVHFFTILESIKRKGRWKIEGFSLEHMSFSPPSDQFLQTYSADCHLPSRWKVQSKERRAQHFSTSFLSTSINSQSTPKTIVMEVHLQFHSFNCKKHSPTKVVNSSIVYPLPLNRLDNVHNQSILKPSSGINNKITKSMKIPFNRSLERLFESQRA